MAPTDIDSKENRRFFRIYFDEKPLLCRVDSHNLRIPAAIENISGGGLAFLTRRVVPFMGRDISTFNFVIEGESFSISGRALSLVVIGSGVFYQRAEFTLINEFERERLIKSIQYLEILLHQKANTEETFYYKDEDGMQKFMSVFRRYKKHLERTKEDGLTDNTKRAVSTCR